jgi:hypothetical protein
MLTLLIAAAAARFGKFVMVRRKSLPESLGQ